MIDTILKFKKTALFIGLVLLVVVIVIVVRAFQTPTLAGGSINLFNTTFLDAVSKQVLGGLGGMQQSPIVSTEDLGEISPLAGMVTIEKDAFTVRDRTAETEYLTLRASVRNAQPINISNWSLQSLVSDTWIGLPQGAANFHAGVVNEIDDIYLNPGEKAIVATAISPVGVSFRVNDCSGFLSSMQQFTPSLHTSCVNPTLLFPATVENIKKYGDACLTIVANLPACTYVSSEALAQVSTECKAALQDTFTYNSCVALRQNDKDFWRAREWRIFLNQNKRLWKDSYEVIRLLDDHNRTVDVFAY